MNIPDKAVEAAALALDEYWGGRYAPNAVEELSDEMRVVLEAAAPFIAAQALRDAALALDRGYSAAYHHGEGDINLWRKLHEASYWLRDRADAEEQ